MTRDYVNTETSSRDYTNGNDKVSLLTQVLEKYDNNMKLLRRIKYSLTVDCNKEINKIESSTKSNIGSIKTVK